MKNFLNKLNTLEKKHLGLIIGIQFLLIAVLFTNSFILSPSKSVLSETTTKSDQITGDVKSCLSLSNAERPLCAKMIGVKIANNFSDPAERLKECSKFRPYAFTLDCEEGLSEVSASQ